MADYDVTNLNANLNGSAISGIRNVILKNSSGTLSLQKVFKYSNSGNNYTWNRTDETLYLEQCPKFATYQLKVYFKSGSSVVEYFYGSSSSYDTTSLDSYDSPKVPYGTIYEVIYTRKVGAALGSFSMNNNRKAALRNSDDKYGIVAYENVYGSNSGITVAADKLTIRGMVTKSTYIFTPVHFCSALKGNTTEADSTVYNTTINSVTTKFLNPTSCPDNSSANESDFDLKPYYIRIKLPTTCSLNMIGINWNNTYHGSWSSSEAYYKNRILLWLIR